MAEAGGELVTLVAAWPDRRDGVVVVAAAVQRPAERQADQVGADHVGPRPVQPERAQVDDDQPGRAVAQFGRGDAEVCPFRRAPAGDHDVGPVQQAAQPLHAVGGPVVEHHAALADVVEPEVQAGVRVAVAGARRGRADVAARRAFGELDLDHVGAHGRQQLAERLACRVAGQLDDREIAVRRGFGHQITPDAVSSANSSSADAEEFLEYVLVVLAEQRAGAPVVRRHAVEVDRDALEPGFADHRVVHLEEDPAVGELRVGLVEVLGVLHRAGPDAGFLQELGRLVAVTLAGPRRDRFIQCVLVLPARLLAREALVRCPGGSPDRVGEARPLLVVEHGDRHPAVLAAGRVYPVRSGGRML